jgi:hypothetical protein
VPFGLWKDHPRMLDAQEAAKKMAAAFYELIVARDALDA